MSIFLPHNANCVHATSLFEICALLFFCATTLFSYHGDNMKAFDHAIQHLAYICYIAVFGFIIWPLLLNVLLITSSNSVEMRRYVVLRLCHTHTIHTYSLRYFGWSLFGFFMIGEYNMFQYISMQNLWYENINIVKVSHVDWVSSVYLSIHQSTLSFAT